MVLAIQSVRAGVTEADVVMPASFISLDALGDEFDLDRLEVHLLHARGRLVVVEFADLLEEGHRVLVAGPETLEVQDAESAEATEFDRGVGRHRAVHRRTEHRQLELVGVDLPGDVDVLGVAGPSRGHDGDVVEAVGLSRRFIDADLNFCHGDLRLRNSNPKNGIALYRNSTGRSYGHDLFASGHSTPVTTQSNSVRRARSPPR